MPSAQSPRRRTQTSRPRWRCRAIYAAQLSTSADLAEGVRSFLERRSPQFRDKIDRTLTAAVCIDAGCVAVRLHCKERGSDKRNGDRDAKSSDRTTKGGSDASYRSDCARSCLPRDRRQRCNRSHGRNTQARRRPAARHRRRADELRLPCRGDVVRAAGAGAALFDAAEIRHQRLFEDRRRSRGFLDGVAGPAHLHVQDEAGRQIPRRQRIVIGRHQGDVRSSAQSAAGRHVGSPRPVLQHRFASRRRRPTPWCSS